MSAPINPDTAAALLGEPEDASRSKRGSTNKGVLIGGTGAVGLIGGVVLFLSQAGYLVTPAERERDRVAIRAELSEVRDGMKDLTRELQSLRADLARSDRNAVTWSDLSVLLSELRSLNAEKGFKVPSVRTGSRFDSRDPER